MVSPGLVLLLQVGHCCTFLSGGTKYIKGYFIIDVHLYITGSYVPECSGQAGVAEQVAARGGYHLIT